MGCSPSRVQPNHTALAEDDGSRPMQNPDKSPDLASSDGPPADPYTASVLVAVHPATSFTSSPSPLSLTLHAPPSSDSVPLQSILRQPGKKKDFDAIRALKNLPTLASPKAAPPTSPSPRKADLRVDSEPARELRESPRRESLQPLPEQQTPSPTAGSGRKLSTGGGNSNGASRQNSLKVKKVKRRTSHQGMLSKLALQFPAIRRSFDAVYAAFTLCCQQKGSARGRGVRQLGHMSADLFPDFIRHLTRTQLTPAQLQELLTHAKVTEAATLTFRETLIAVALGYYLRPQAVGDGGEEGSDSTWATVGYGFRVIEKAFRDIDDDGSGMLSVAEMKQALFATAKEGGGDGVETEWTEVDERDQGTLDERFKELDLNGDGDVEFREFLYGVVSWVGMTSDEEADDADTNQA